MEMVFRPLDVADPRDRDELIGFLTSNRFPFHVTASPTRASVEQRIADGAFTGPDHVVLRVDVDGAPEGLVVLDDLDEDVPMIDVRLAEAARDRGIGTELVRALATHVFDSFPAVSRIEAQTRDDNHAMRRVLARNGWVLAALARGPGPAHDGMHRDSVAYGLLRHDHRTGTTTPFLDAAAQHSTGR
jgi:RimJ/RimL family protein N-acetyltransferase